MIGPRCSVEHEFSIEDCVPHWKRLVRVMREEEPCLEVVLVLTVYLQRDTKSLWGYAITGIDPPGRRRGHLRRAG